MGILVLGAVAIALLLLGFFLVVAWQVWRDFRRTKPSERALWNYVSLGAALSIPAALIYPAFPGVPLAIWQCKTRGGEKIREYVRADSYVLALGDSHALRYDLEQLGFDLLDRKIAYVEISGVAQSALYYQLHATRSRGPVRKRSAPKLALPAGLRFFVAESNAENCITSAADEFSAKRFRETQQRLRLPESLCIAFEAIDTSSAKYSVTYEEEQETFPTPIFWKKFLLKRVSDGRLMAEERGFQYRPYGPGLISGFVGTLAGQSLYAEGIGCKGSASHRGQFLQSLQGARETYLSDERIRSSVELTKFYALQ
jgi:hypothetical protein